jgi:hypothetical protein
MQQRRRLSVQATKGSSEFDANATGGYADEAATGDSSGAATKQFYQTAARSKKGYVPYNSRKQNQVWKREMRFRFKNILLSGSFLNKIAFVFLYSPLHPHATRL